MYTISKNAHQEIEEQEAGKNEADPAKTGNPGNHANGRTEEMTPLKAIHRFCVECVGSSHLVEECRGDKMICRQGDENGRCFFFPFRTGKGRPSVKLIRNFCRECMGGKTSFVRECPSTTCPVFPYRMGNNPKRAGIGNVTRFKKHEKPILTGIF